MASFIALFHSPSSDSSWHFTTRLPWICCFWILVKLSLNVCVSLLINSFISKTMNPHTEHWYLLYNQPCSIKEGSEVWITPCFYLIPKFTDIPFYMLPVLAHAQQGKSLCGHLKPLRSLDFSPSIPTSSFPSLYLTSPLLNLSLEDVFCHFSLPHLPPHSPH